MKQDEHNNSRDPWYRKLWRDHLHHSFSKTGKESSERAVEQLVELIAQKGELKAVDTELLRVF